MQQHRLILMRHAKSDWSQPSTGDHDRSLNTRGQAAAPKMARWLFSSGHLPDLILASTARRVRETVSGMMSNWDPRPPVYESESLYLATPEAILQAVRTDSLDKASVMVVAHNPGMQYLASQLASRELQFPTAAIAIFEFQIESWQQLAISSDVKLVDYVFPKGLED